MEKKKIRQGIYTKCNNIIKLKIYLLSKYIKT